MEIKPLLQYAAYQCIVCKELRNPVKEKPIAMNIIVQFRLDPKDGQIHSHSVPGPVCPECFRYGMEKDAIINIEEIAPDETAPPKSAKDEPTGLVSS